MRLIPICAALMLWGVASAQEPPRDAPLTWLQQPTGEDLVKHYPEAATVQSVEGVATIECMLETDASLRCVVTAESPQGWGFGDAAMRISQEFRVQPAIQNGQPQRGRIRRTIRFRLPDIDPDFAGWTPQERALFEAMSPPELPRWDDAPSFYAVLDHYPAQARRDRVRGRGVLSCTVNADRRLACTQVLETPLGMGFGAAALALSARFRVSDSDEGFAARHRNTAFLLPIAFSDRADQVPVNRFYSGIAPIEMPPIPVPPEGYPPAALAMRIEATVALLCTLRANGPPECVVEEESAPGWGFAERLIEGVRQAPWRLDELEVLDGDQVRFRFVFTPPDPA